MAIPFEDVGEPAWLTDAMWSTPGSESIWATSPAKVDKHSTGGVGDRNIADSRATAAASAFCSDDVRPGSGHRRDADKLESIPGFRVNLSLEEMKAALARVGCAMIGQTSQIAPADKKLYALRDVTATVESIPLISASIMSKKIAEGIDALVLDVKTGSGAFMKTEADSRRLAESLVSIGNASGVKTEAIITAMESPLGCAVGNALEVIECLEVLKGGGPRDLVDVSVELAARMLVLGRVATDRADAERQVRGAIASGTGLDRFRRIIEAQGGDPRVVDDYSRLPQAPRRHVLGASRGGYVSRFDAELVWAVRPWRSRRSRSGRGSGRSRRGYHGRPPGPKFAPATRCWCTTAAARDWREGAGHESHHNSRRPGVSR
jgi:pyrimidine-nucleoside phosphorylase